MMKCVRLLSLVAGLGFALTGISQRAAVAQSCSVIGSSVSVVRAIAIPPRPLRSAMVESLPATHESVPTNLIMGLRRA